MDAHLVRPIWPQTQFASDVVSVSSSSSLRDSRWGNAINLYFLIDFSIFPISCWKLKSNEMKWNEFKNNHNFTFVFYVCLCFNWRKVFDSILLLSYRRNRNELWFVFLGYGVIVDWETLSEGQFEALSGSFVGIHLISLTIIVNHIDSNYNHVCWGIVM